MPRSSPSSAPTATGQDHAARRLRTLFALRLLGQARLPPLRAPRRPQLRVDPRGGRQPARPHRQAALLPARLDEVTLACRIRKAGGDWIPRLHHRRRQPADRGAGASNDWIGLRDYQHRLAWGGLTPAITKVLALEQGDTDKLCEYSPRRCSSLGSTSSATRRCWTTTRPRAREQKSAERELGELGIDLDRLKTQAEEKKAEANRYLEWNSSPTRSTRWKRGSCRAWRSPSSFAISPPSAPSIPRRPRARRQARRAARIAPAPRDRARRTGGRAGRAQAPEGGRPRPSSATSPPTTACATSTGCSKSATCCAPSSPASTAPTPWRWRRSTRRPTPRSPHLRRKERELVAAFEERSETLRGERNRAGAPGDAEVARFRASG